MTAPRWMVVVFAALCLLVVADAAAAATTVTIPRPDAVEREQKAAAAREADLSVRVAKLEGRKTPSFWLGLVSGALLALLGQVLKWAYDAVSARRRDAVVLGVGREELADIKSRASRNLITVETEIETLASGESSPAPLVPLAAPGIAGLWREPPATLRKQANAVRLTTDLLAAVQHTNDLGARRDVVALSDSDNRAVRLEALDQLLKQQLEGVGRAVDAVAAVWPKNGGGQ